MGSVTVAGILLYGVHASRPASGVATGTLYACSTHGLVYQTTDTGATWVTWATLGTALTAAGTGDMVASAPGDTVSAGASGKYSDGAHRHARESWGASGDIGASAPADASTAGATGKVADAGHKHSRLSERALYEFVIDGGGSAITTGIKGDLYVPDAFTITGVVMLADQSGSIVVDIWNDTYANYPPTDADSLPGAGTPPTISSTTKSKDTTLTSWDTTVPADSTLRFNVDSATTITRVVVAIYGVRT